MNNLNKAARLFDAIKEFDIQAKRREAGTTDIYAAHSISIDISTLLHEIQMLGGYLYPLAKEVGITLIYENFAVLKDQSSGQGMAKEAAKKLLIHGKWKIWDKKPSSR